MHGAHKTPGLWQQLPNCRGSELGKIGTSVNGSEVREIPARNDIMTANLCQSQHGNMKCQAELRKSLHCLFAGKLQMLP